MAQHSELKIGDTVRVPIVERNIVAGWGQYKQILTACKNETLMGVVKYTNHESSRVGVEFFNLIANVPEDINIKSNPFSAFGKGKNAYCLYVKSDVCSIVQQLPDPCTLKQMQEEFTVGIDPHHKEREDYVQNYNGLLIKARRIGASYGIKTWMDSWMENRHDEMEDQFTKGFFIPNYYQAVTIHDPLQFLLLLCP